MSFDWVYLEQVADVVDSLHKTPAYCHEGSSMVRVTDVRYGYLDLNDCLRVSPETYAEFSRRYKPQLGDIVITRVGSYGNTAIVKDTHFCLGQNTAAIIPKHINARYLYAALNSPQIKAEIEAQVVGSTQKTLSLARIKKLNIPRHSPDVEDGIACLIGTLDDRITLLRETNQTLESIAQAIFKSWFVDFDPVRAKMKGRQPEGMDEDTAALFPDSFEESELGLIPRGWEPARLDSFLELAYGKALKADSRRPGGVPVYGSGGLTGWHDTPLVKVPSIIVGRKGTVGSLCWESRPFFPIDTVFYVKTTRPLTYCYELLKTRGLSQMNTDAAVPGLNRENVYRLLVPNAPLSVIEAYHSTAQILRQSIDQNEQRSTTLELLRDTLLPRLISGQLRLPEAQEQIEAALS